MFGLFKQKPGEIARLVELNVISPEEARQMLGLNELKKASIPWHGQTEQGTIIEPDRSDITQGLPLKDLVGE